MSTNRTFTSEEPLNILLRRRRLELGLLQAEIAEELHVSVEAVTHVGVWPPTHGSRETSTARGSSGNRSQGVVHQSVV